MKELKSIDLSCLSREQLERLVLVQLRSIEELEDRVSELEELTSFQPELN